MYSIGSACAGARHQRFAGQLQLECGRAQRVPLRKVPGLRRRAHQAANLVGPAHIASRDHVEVLDALGVRAVGVGRGDSGERNQRVADPPIELPPHAEVHAVVQGDGVPLVRLAAGVASGAPATGVAREPLPVDVA